MWGIVKFMIVAIILVFLVQLLLNGISNLLNSNTNVQGNWRTSVPMEQEAQFHDIPATDLWSFVPRPVYRVAVDVIDVVARLYEEGKRAVLRVFPSVA